jgi:hypothetical protein
MVDKICELADQVILIALYLHIPSDRAFVVPFKVGSPREQHNQVPSVPVQ